MTPESGKIWRDLRNGFIAGMALLLPLVVTTFVVHVLVTRIGAPAGQVIFNNLFDEFPKEGSPSWYVVNIIATLAVFMIITSAGVFSRYVFGRWIVGMSERVIAAVPVINTVYNTVKQIVDTFSEQQKAIFQKVVLVDYPRKGVFAIGFLTSEAKGEVQAKTGAELVNVFVPTTPNPTSGFLLMVPREEVTDLEMSVTDGMKLIISGGAVTPPYSAAKAVEPPALTVTEKQA